MDADARFAELNLALPPAPKPVGVYKPIVVVGDLAYLSGHGPLRPDKTLITGKVGADLSLEEGTLAARQVGLALLATLKAQLGTLTRVRRIIKVLGMVNAVPDFREHPTVINGASELFAAVWGPDDGVGARSAVGMASLPANMAVEIEMIVEVQSFHGVSAKQ
jgi:enamine deaminase RidA (YjgF/YER057c/UK114 family)